MSSWICILHLHFPPADLLGGITFAFLSEKALNWLSFKLSCFAFVSRIILQCEINFENVRDHGIVCVCRLPRGFLSHTAATASLALQLTCLQKPFTGQADRASPLVRDYDAQVQKYYGLDLEKQRISHEVHNDAGRCQTGFFQSTLYTIPLQSHPQIEPAICSIKGLSPTYKFRYQIQLVAPSCI